MSSKYLDFYLKNCTSVDFKTFSSVKNKVLEYLADEDCPDETKIIFGTWLFKKIYMMFKFRGSDKDSVCKDLIPPVERSQNVISKGEYLQFHDLEAVSKMALYFYLHRFDNQDKFFILQLLNDAELIKGYLQNSNIKDDELIEHFLRWIELSQIEEQKSNILDILLRYYPKNENVKNVYEKMRFEGGSKDLYNDRQNVHDEEITLEVSRVAQELMQWGYEHSFSDTRNCPICEEIKPGKETKISDWGRGYLCSKYPEDKRDIIECVITRCCIDTSSFQGSGKTPATFTIADIFYTLLNYIRHNPIDEDSLLSILIEEMDAMKELCASGYIARCMTVLQGQDPDGKFDIKLSFKRKLYAILSSRIGKDMRETADENVSLGTMSPDHAHYYISFIERTVNKYLPSLLIENPTEDFSRCISKVLEDISGFEGWIFCENKVMYEKPAEILILDAPIQNT